MGRTRSPRRPATVSAADLVKQKLRIGRLLPDIDPGDLDLILSGLARPFGSGRRFFLREIKPGVRIF